MVAFQLFLILHPKIPMSKRYLIIGFIFYLIILSDITTFARLTEVTQNVNTELIATVISFYGLLISFIGIYIYKKKLVYY